MQVQGFPHLFIAWSVCCDRFVFFSLLLLSKRRGSSWKEAKKGPQTQATQVEITITRMHLKIGKIHTTHTPWRFPKESFLVKQTWHVRRSRTKDKIMHHESMVSHSQFKHHHEERRPTGDQNCRACSANENDSFNLLVNSCKEDSKQGDINNQGDLRQRNHKHKWTTWWIHDMMR